MRYALLSDIHANLHALESVLEDIQMRKIDLIICLGDIVGYGPKPQETADLIRSVCRYFIMGNHDAVVAGFMDPSSFNPAARYAIEWTVKQLNEETIKFMKDMPFELTASSFVCCHGEFIAPARYGYIFTQQDALESFAATDKKLLFTGHSHVPLYFEMSNKDMPVLHRPQKFKILEGMRYLVNVGSVGQSRDMDLRACYCVYDTKEETIEHVRVAYDVDKTRSEMILADIPLSPAIFRSVPPPPQEDTPLKVDLTPVATPIPEADEKDFTPQPTAINVKERRAQFIAESNNIKTPVHISLFIMIFIFGLILGVILFQRFYSKDDSTVPHDQAPSEVIVTDPHELATLSEIPSLTDVLERPRETTSRAFQIKPSTQDSARAETDSQTLKPVKEVRKPIPFTPDSDVVLSLANDSAYTLYFSQLRAPRSLWKIIPSHLGQTVASLPSNGGLKMNNDISGQKLVIESVPFVEIPDLVFTMKMQASLCSFDSGRTQIFLLDDLTGKTLYQCNVKEQGVTHFNYTSTSSYWVKRVRLRIEMNTLGTLYIPSIQIAYPKRLNPPVMVDGVECKYLTLDTSVLPTVLLRAKSEVISFNKSASLDKYITKIDNWNVRLSKITQDFHFALESGKPRLCYALKDPISFDAFTSQIQLPQEDETTSLRFTYALDKTSFSGNLEIQIIFVDDRGQFWLADHKQLNEFVTGRVVLEVKNPQPQKPFLRYMIRIHGTFQGELRFTRFMMERFFQ